MVVKKVMTLANRNQKGRKSSIKNSSKCISIHKSLFLQHRPNICKQYNAISGKKRKLRQRASKLTALEMLTDKYKQKAELKEKELESRKLEIDFEKEKYHAKVEGRKANFQLEMKERKAFIALLQKKS